MGTEWKGRRQTQKATTNTPNRNAKKTHSNKRPQSTRPRRTPTNEVLGCHLLVIPGHCGRAGSPASCNPEPSAATSQQTAPIPGFSPPSSRQRVFQRILLNFHFPTENLPVVPISYGSKCKSLAWYSGTSKTGPHR